MLHLWNHESSRWIYLFSTTDSIHYFLPSFFFFFPRYFPKILTAQNAKFPKLFGAGKGIVRRARYSPAWYERRNSRSEKAKVFPLLFKFWCELLKLSLCCHLLICHMHHDKQLAMHPSRFSGYTELFNVGKHILPIQRILNQGNVRFNLSSLTVFSF